MDKYNDFKNFIDNFIDNFKNHINNLNDSALNPFMCQKCLHWDFISIVVKCSFQSRNVNIILNYGGENLFDFREQFPQKIKMERVMDKNTGGHISIILL